MSTIDTSGNIHKGAGSPGGGQFAGKVNTSPASTLVADDESTAACARCERPADPANGLCDIHDTRWGSLSVDVGTRTPWGNAGHVTHIAPGMVIADTPGHGGLKLSPERNALIPPALRNSSGWYEEDCEINIPLRYFPDAWLTQPHTQGRDRDEFIESCDSSIKNWFPDKWEAANGRELEPGESREKDRQEWTKRHADQPIVTSASGAESDPEMVVVSARIGGREGGGEEAEYLVPRSEYRSRLNTEPGQDSRFIVDPTRHPKLPPKPRVQPETAAVIRVAGDRLSSSALSQSYIDGAITGTARDRVAKDLNQRWRRADGRVESLREIIEEQGVSGKTAYQEGASMKYAVLQPTGDGGHYSLKVSKATWDFLDSVPDTRSPAARAQQEASAHYERMDRKIVGPTRAEQERSSALYAEAKRLREQEDADRNAREGTPEERDAARKLAQAERERQAVISA